MEPLSARVASRYLTAGSSRHLGEALIKAKRGLNGEAIALLQKVEVWSGDRQGNRLKSRALHLLEEASAEEVPQQTAVTAVSKLQEHLGVR